MKNKNIIALFVFLALSLIFTQFFIQNDAFYSITIGKDILNNGIDMLDHYSFLNLNYTYPHWLFDISLYLVYKYAGYIGLYFTNVIFGTFLSFILFKILNKETDNFIISLIVSCFSLYFMNSFIASRAQTVTYILFVLEYVCIKNYLKTGKKINFLFLSLILLLIFNLHIAVYPVFYIIFLPYIAEYLLALYRNKEINNKFIKKEKGRFINAKTGIYLDKIDIKYEKNMKYLLMFIPLSLLIGFITPIGLNSYTYIFKTMAGDSTFYIKEHQPILLVEEALFSIEIVLFLLTILLMRIKYRITDILYIFGFMIMAFSSIRNQSLFNIFWVLTVGKQISLYLVTEDAKTIKLIDNILLNKYVYSFLIISFALFIGIKGYLNYNVDLNEMIPDRFYPTLATEYILDNIDVDNMRIYNEYNVGSYLLFNNIKVFFDSRADLYTKEFNSSLEKSIFEEVDNMTYYNYKDLFERFNITHVLVNNHSSNLLNAYEKDTNMNKIYNDEHFSIYELVGD